MKILLHTTAQQNGKTTANKQNTFFFNTIKISPPPCPPSTHTQRSYTKYKYTKLYIFPSLPLSYSLTPPPSPFHTLII